MKVLKKIVFLIMILFLPIIVNAQSKYEITSIEQIDINGQVIEKEKPSFSNGKLSINVSMNNPGDYIKYEISLKNISNKEFIMNINTSELSDEYIKYIVEYEKNSPIIKAHETKKIQLLIKMDKDIPPQTLMSTNAIYNTKKTISISLNNDEKVENNPDTFSNTIIILSLILLITIILIIIIKYKKARNILSILLILYLLIPPQIIAVEKVDLVIESEVEINRQDFYTIKELVNDEYVYKQYPYIKGMTGEEYLRLNEQQQLDGFYIIPNKCNGYYYENFKYIKCMDEKNDYEICQEENPIVKTYDFYTSPIMNSESGYYTYFTCCLSGETIVETKNKKTKKRKKKKLKDLNYDDLLLVWDFDNGCLEWAETLWIQEPEKVPFYYELVFDDGTKLEVIGNHKIFDVDKSRFVNCIEDNEFNIGSHTINDKNEIITLVSKQRINKENYAYNVITKKHINVFANSLLTSWNINNLYNIDSKKFVKDITAPKVELDKTKIPKEYYESLRLSEIPYDLYGNMQKTQEYIYDLVNRLEKNKRK